VQRNNSIDADALLSQSALRELMPYVNFKGKMAGDVTASLWFFSLGFFALRSHKGDIKETFPSSGRCKPRVAP
jgi:hypothetical protein